ncbi:MAG: hypothetical protein PIR02_15975 [Microbacterium enclense]
MASSLTYPTPAVTGTENLTSEQIHAFLLSKTLFARRVRDIAAQRFIANALLKARLRVEGGAILYEGGEPLFAADDPEVVAPGGEIPRSQVYTGDLAGAAVEKLARDVPIFDESIKRRGIDVVNKTINQLVNTMVRYVDSAALGVIASKVSQSINAIGSWTTVDGIVRSIEMTKAIAEESGEGHTLDTIVLKPTAYASVMATFLAAGLLPREQNNPLLTGTWPTVLDTTWLRSSHTPTAAPLFVDTDELGGMADQTDVSPGYTSAGDGIETKSLREDKDFEGYLVRARRITVPVVTDATAAYAITGTGL